MKNVNPLSLFDDHFLMEKLTKLGDPLQKLRNYINWKIFKAPLDKAFRDEAKDMSKVGRPSFDKAVLCQYSQHTRQTFKSFNLNIFQVIATFYVTMVFFYFPTETIGCESFFNAINYAFFWRPGQ